MPDLFVHHLASFGSGLRSGAWSCMWQNTAEIFGLGWAPHGGSPGPSHLSIGLLSVHSLLSHKLIFLSLGKFLFPPRRLVSPQAYLQRLQPASHTGLSYSAQEAQSLGWPPLAQDGTDGNPAVTNILKPSPLGHPVLDRKFCSQTPRYRDSDSKSPNTVNSGLLGARCHPVKFYVLLTGSSRIQPEAWERGLQDPGIPSPLGCPAPSQPGGPGLYHRSRDLSEGATQALRDRSQQAVLL